MNADFQDQLSVTSCFENINAIYALTAFGCEFDPQFSMSHHRFLLHQDWVARSWVKVTQD